MKRTLVILTHIFIFVTLGFTQIADDAIRLRNTELGFGARNLAMGGNGVASATDYSAIYWNPSLLTGIKHSQLLVEFSHTQFQNDATFFGTESSFDESYTRLRSIGLAVPLDVSRGSFVLGFGYQFVRDMDEYLNFNGFNTLSNGFEINVDDNYELFDKNVQQSEEINSEGGLRQWSAGAGVAVSPNLDIGLTLNFWGGKEDYYFIFEQTDKENNYSQFPLDFHRYKLNNNLESSFNATNLKLGGRFKLNRSVQLAAAIEFPTTYTITEKFSMSDEIEYDDGYIDFYDEEPGEWKYKVKTPYRFDSGILLRNRNLKITGSVTYRDWTQTRFEKPDEYLYEEDYVDLLGENEFLRKDFRATLNYHIGGEIFLRGSNLAIRGGYAVHPSPLKDANSDDDRKFYTGGLGFRVGPYTWLDLTLVRGSWNRTTSDIYTPGGTFEDVTENRIFAGVRVSF